MKRQCYTAIWGLLVVSFLCLIGTGAAWAGNLFSGPVNSPAGRYPYALGAGDFNGDGDIDLAVTNNDFQSDHDSHVRILLGEGSGIFEPPVSYRVGAEPNSVAVGDFNRDGRLDLAVISFGNSPKALGVLLGDGDGTFQPEVRWNVGLSPVKVTVGDFNGDGKLDVAVVNDGTRGFVSVLPGNGDGTFQPKVKTPVAHCPYDIVAGDLNGDGDLDLVTSGGCGPKKYTNALLGNGDGTFKIAWTAISRDQQFPLAAGDFNGDGKLDLVATNGAELSIRLGKGDGTFGKRVNYPVDGAGLIAVADYDGDGNLDIAVTSRSGVGVLLGKGDGTFGPLSTYPLNPVAGPAGMLAVDVNGDKKTDLVLTDHFNKVVSVLLNTGHR